MPKRRSPPARLALAALAWRCPASGAVLPPNPTIPLAPSASSCRRAPAAHPDLIPRLLGEALTARWGQPVVIEHRPGAGGNLGAEFVFKAAPDGYTLLSTWSSPLVVNQSLYAKINYDPATFVVIAVIATSPNVLVVHPKLPVRRSPSLPSMPRPTPTSSPTPRSASAARRIWRWRCSKPSQASRSGASPTIADSRPRSLTRSPARSTWCSAISPMSARISPTDP